MKRLVLVSLLGSMLVQPHPVNGQETSSPRINSSKDDFTQLVDLLFKSGEENPFKEHIAPVIGLPHAMPALGRTITEEHRGKDNDVHECYLVYEQITEASSGQSKRPYCFYIRKHRISGHDDLAEYFRIDLQGRLEKIISIHGKRDDAGKIVPGAGVALEQDIDSVESRKAFAAEMAAMRKWLKAQKKIPSPASSSGGSQGTTSAAAAAP